MNYRYFIYKNPNGSSPSNPFDELLGPVKRPSLKARQVKLLKLRLWTRSKTVAKEFLKTLIKSGAVDDFSGMDTDSKKRNVRQYLKNNYKLSEKKLTKYTKLIMGVLRKKGKILLRQAGREINTGNSKETSTAFIDRSFTGPSDKIAKYKNRVTSKFFKDLAESLLTGKLLTSQNDADSYQAKLNKVLNKYGVKILIGFSQGKINYRLLFNGPKAWKNVSVYSKRREKRILSKRKRKNIRKDLRKIV